MSAMHESVPSSTGYTYDHSSLLLLAMDIEENPGPMEREDFERMLKRMREDLEESMTKKFQEILACEMEKLRDDFHSLAERVEEIERGVSGKEEKLTEQREDIDTIEERVDGLEFLIEEVNERVEQQEIRSLRDNVLLYGVEESEENERHEYSMRKVLHKVNQVLESPLHWLQGTDITRAHCIGRRAAEKSRPRIERLARSMGKLTILQKRKELRARSIRTPAAHQRLREVPASGVARPQVTAINKKAKRVFGNGPNEASAGFGSVPAESKFNFGAAGSAAAPSNNAFKMTANDGASGWSGGSVGSLAGLFKCPAGDWDCEMHNVANKSESVKSVCFGTPHPGTEPSAALAKTVPTSSFSFGNPTSSSSMVLNSGGGFSFSSSSANPITTSSGFKFGSADSGGAKSGDNSQAPASSGFQFGASEQSKPLGSASALADKTAAPATATGASGWSGGSVGSLAGLFKRPAGDWDCKMCNVFNELESVTCVRCGTPRPGTEPSAFSASPNVTAGQNSSFLVRPRQIAAARRLKR